MDFKEYLDKYVFKVSHPITERAKQREEILKAILIEEEIEKGKTVVIPTNQKTEEYAWLQALNTD